MRHPFKMISLSSSVNSPSVKVISFIPLLLYKGLVMIHDKRYVNFVEEQGGEK